MGYRQVAIASNSFGIPLVRPRHRQFPHQFRWNSTSSAMLRHTACIRSQFLAHLYGNSNCASFHTRTISDVLGLVKNSSRLRPKYDLGAIPLRHRCSPTYRHYSFSPHQVKKAWKMSMYLTALAVGMVGASYAAVPLYQTFCQATGYGGTVQRRESVEEKIARHSKDEATDSREITVQFNADVADGMQWKFIPTQREVRVKPGESALAFYTAENQSSSPITGVSSYNVTPMKAAVYFNKIQCFCFEEQRLLPGEQVDMPVFFYIDPEFLSDPKMKGINNLILSYTFFKVPDEDEEYIV
ncbi:hypothetical protein V2J09_016877 [Rumex salicifolius]